MSGSRAGRGPGSARPRETSAVGSGPACPAGHRYPAQSVELSNPDAALRSEERGVTPALIQAYHSVPGTHFPKKVWVTEHISAGLHRPSPGRLSPTGGRAGRAALTSSAGSRRIPGASAPAVPPSPATWTRGCNTAAGRARPPPGLTHQCRRRKWPAGSGRSWGGANTGRLKAPPAPGGLCFGGFAAPW